jgi:hypothetical protein
VTGIAQPHIDAVVQADQGIEALLHQVGRQVTAGHLGAPEGDNAVATWILVLEAVLPASPATTKALTDFVAYTRSRASDEQAVGRVAVAIDLLVFADEATRLLQSTASASSSAAARPIAPAGSVPDASPSTLPAAIATRDTHPSEAPSGSAQTAATPEIQRNMIDPAQTQMPHVGSNDTNASLASELRNKEAMTRAPPVGETAIQAPRPGAVARPPQQQASAAASARRGDAMLAIQDITAARLFYEYAANAGNGRAAMALAETYDAAFLTQLGAVGTRPNPVMAAEWYRKAAALGSRGAEARLQTLGVEAAK